MIPPQISRCRSATRGEPDHQQWHTDQPLKPAVQQFRTYIITRNITSRSTDLMFSPELKKGSMELLILSMLEQSERHGYEIGKLIETRSGGRLEFRISTLYSVLYRMEDHGWIKGRWVEKQGQRSRCYYRITAEGRRVLEARHQNWREFVGVINELIGARHA
jgi:DNA-binding PadR family transcriptional regulator